MFDTELENLGEYLKRRIASYEPQTVTYRFGHVSKTGDGVVRVTGLPNRRYGELLEFEGGVYGMTLDLEEEGTGAVLLSATDNVSIGDMVRGTNRGVEIPVGEELLGRIVDPIGRPYDGEPLDVRSTLPVERPAPPLIDRRPVDTPLQTGIMAIDSMIPIGRGQRELIIGDRQTGKSTIALDTILNQKNSGVLCIYCAIGQKASTIAQVIQILREGGAMPYSTVVAATASDSPAMQYLAPYAACAIAESFMESGRDVLIVYDDLSKHAVAYRTMSLLLRRPPGREAYPGDVFYLHSRLLERAACLSKEKGGGSMTALPIIETTGGNISAYIPTNVISITDGQIYLESELFHSGIRPAVNTGLSVSRVGRAAQHQAMRRVSGSLRIELAQYREMAVFARFGADIDPSTKRMLTRGEHLTMLFKQNKGLTYLLSDMVCLLFAFNRNVFEPFPAADMAEVGMDLLRELRQQCPSLIQRIDQTGTLDDSSAEDLGGYIDKWLSGRLAKQELDKAPNPQSGG